MQNTLSFFCLLLGPPGFRTVGFLLLQCSSGVVRYPKGSPGVGHNTFLSSPYLCFINVFIGDLYVFCVDPLMG